jgi:hypothetical protein
MAWWRRHLRIISRLLVLDGRDASIGNSNLASVDLVAVLCLTKRTQRSIRRDGRHRWFKVVAPVLFWAV